MGKRIKEMGGFYVGQRVRLSVAGEGAFPKRAHGKIGTVKGIVDLSGVVALDGTRSFALKVSFDGYGKATLFQGNGAYFLPA